MNQKLSTSASTAVLGGLAAVAVIIGVAAKGGGPTDAQVPAEVSNAVTTDASTEPMTAATDPDTSVSSDTGMSINDPALKPLCMMVPAQGVGMTYNGQRYVLVGTGCIAATETPGATQGGETTASDFGSAVQQVYELPDGSIYTLDAADGTWNAWAAAQP